MYLSNTVYLSLYIKQLDDLFNLLDTQSLPVLDHLSVSFIKCLKNDFKIINMNNIASRLRSLKLGYMSMNDLLIFFSFVHLPLLEQLILIDIHDDCKFNKQIFRLNFSLKIVTCFLKI